MSERFFSCSIALLVAVTSAAIVWMGLERLSWETRRTTLTVGELQLGENHFSFNSDGDKEPCFGALTATLHDDGNNFSITFRGWLTLSLLGKLWVQDFHGELSFNPLAQLGVSLLEIPIGDDFVRIGTRNINPITVMVFRSSKDEKPLFQQDLPGPVELRKAGTLFKITSPLPADIGVQSALTPMLSVMPLRVKRDISRSCVQTRSRPLDLTTALNTVSRLRAQITNLLPLRIP